ncbi:AAA family ATPase [Flavobacteriaceae bacterium TP-CH-4]|uniref:Shikimate kinase n=1 Tax=Pelagihabitans pacificus TaxID=2696054 RepID=A0A967E4N3_9FLAO|nr:shikimate kinase [Pelagihabitans pacificus]NHF57720.1 AAA family ATPase [Pelagihabitans pacificus]
MKIILLGYMGSGKSTVGKLLAKQMGLEFIDLDDFIEEEEEQKIATIFKVKGEIYFRNKESEYLKKIIQQKKDLVIATGGGTPCYGDNLETLLKTTDHIFYLKVSLNGLVERLGKEKMQRPLIKDIPNGELPEFIGKHLFERSFFYNRATHIISSDGKTAEEIAMEIGKFLV